MQKMLVIEDLFLFSYLKLVMKIAKLIVQDSEIYVKWAKNVSDEQERK